MNGCEDMSLTCSAIKWLLADDTITKSILIPGPGLPPELGKPRRMRSIPLLSLAVSSDMHHRGLQLASRMLDSERTRRCLPGPVRCHPETIPANPRIHVLQDLNYRDAYVPGLFVLLRKDGGCSPQLREHGSTPHTPHTPWSVSGSRLRQPSHAQRSGVVQIHPRTHYSCRHSQETLRRRMHRMQLALGSLNGIDSS